MLFRSDGKLLPYVDNFVNLIVADDLGGVTMDEVQRVLVPHGVAIIGGLISSTMLTLLVVPAAYLYIDRFRLWSKSVLRRAFAVKDEKTHAHGNGHAAEDRL